MSNLKTETTASTGREASEHEHIVSLIIKCPFCSAHYIKKTDNYLLNWVNHCSIALKN